MKVFKEEQRFTQTWLIVILGMGILVPIIIIINEFNSENSTMTLNEMIVSISLMIVAMLPIFFFKLKTRIDEKGIHYQFFPFHLSFKTIHWKEINTAFLRTYDPIGDYGGWGLKGGFRRSKGKALNVKGDLGIQLELQNGKKLLIGTQKKEESERVLETYRDKIK